MDEIAKRRAEKASDGRLWTAADALEDTVNRVRGMTGKVKMAIHLWEVHPDGSKTHNYTTAGLTYPEHIALLIMSMKRVTEEWME